MLSTGLEPSPNPCPGAPPPSPSLSSGAADSVKLAWEDFPIGKSLLSLPNPNDCPGSLHASQATGKLPVVLQRSSTSGKKTPELRVLSSKLVQSLLTAQVERIGQLLESLPKAVRFLLISNIRQFGRCAPRRLHTLLPPAP